MGSTNIRSASGGTVSGRDDKPLTYSTKDSGKWEPTTIAKENQKIRDRLDAHIARGGMNFGHYDENKPGWLVANTPLQQISKLDPDNLNRRVDVKTPPMFKISKEQLKNFGGPLSTLLGGLFGGGKDEVSPTDPMDASERKANYMIPMQVDKGIPSAQSVAGTAYAQDPSDMIKQAATTNYPIDHSTVMKANIAPAGYMHSANVPVTDYPIDHSSVFTPSVSGTNYPIDHSSVVDASIIGDIPGKYAYTQKGADPIMGSALNYYEAGLNTTPEMQYGVPRGGGRNAWTDSRGNRWQWRRNSDGEWYKVNLGPVGQDGNNEEADAMQTTQYPYVDRHAGAGGDKGAGYLTASGLKPGDVDYMNQGGVVHAEAGMMPALAAAAAKKGMTLEEYLQLVYEKDHERQMEDAWLSQYSNADSYNKGGVVHANQGYGGQTYHDRPLRMTKPTGMTWQEFLEMQYNVKKRNEAAAINAATGGRRGTGVGAPIGAVVGTATGMPLGREIGSYMGGRFLNDGGVVHANEGMSPYNPLNWLNAAFGMPKAHGPGVAQRHESGLPPTDAMISATKAKAGAMPSAERTRLGFAPTPLRYGASKLADYFFPSYKTIPSEQSQGTVMPASNPADYNQFTGDLQNIQGSGYPTLNYNYPNSPEMVGMYNALVEQGGPLSKSKTTTTTVKEEYK